ncbi:MAG TPA: polymer-forming cytoskeletal protein [Actinomycetota bacterium]|nr:polymer-forming cytoskeletal protein [Actinomycetota bacterium]
MIRRRLSGPHPLDRGPDAQRPPDGSPARPDPAGEPPEPYRNEPRTIKPKEADVSQRPESIQSVPRAGGDQTVTVIGNGARLEGNLIAAASLRIEGTVTGTISAEGDVIIAPEAEVTADIRATNATLGGHYKGDVVAAGTIELTSTARVEGNLTCRSLIVNQGAIFSGRSIMDGGAKKPSGPTPVPSPSPGPSPSPSPSGPSAPGGPAPGSPK